MHPVTFIGSSSALLLSRNILHSFLTTRFDINRSKSPDAFFWRITKSTGADSYLKLLVGLLAKKNQYKTIQTDTASIFQILV